MHPLGDNQNIDPRLYSLHGMVSLLGGGITERSVLRFIPPMFERWACISVLPSGVHPHPGHLHVGHPLPNPLRLHIFILLRNVPYFRFKFLKCFFFRKSCATPGVERDRMRITPRRATPVSPPLRKVPPNCPRNLRIARRKLLDCEIIFRESSSSHIPPFLLEDWYASWTITKHLECCELCLCSGIFRQLEKEWEIIINERASICACCKYCKPCRENFWSDDSPRESKR